MNSLNQSTTNRAWGTLAELRREMDKLLDDFWTAPRNIRPLQEMDAGWVPPCDVEEEDHHYVISMEMAGVPKDQIKIEFQDHQLVVSGERRHLGQQKEEGRWYSERRFGKFQRSFALPVGVDVEKVEANYQDGILQLYVPKAESAKPKRIKITSGSSASFFGKLLGSSKKEQEGLHSSSESKSENVA